MTTTQSFFLQILGDHLRGRETQPRSDVDWDAVLELARIHQVSGVVYQQCRGFLPEAPGRVLAERHASELFYYYNRTALFRELQQRLTDADIPYFTVKGLNIAQYYPIPALRTMGDCDVVVPAADRERAHELLLAMGFHTHLKEDMDWMYYKNDIEFELHDRLLYHELGNSADSRSVADTAWDHAHPTGEGTRYELDWSFHFLFLLMHLKKHLVHAGVGFRQFMDLDVVLTHRELDWARIESSLQEQGLLRFAQIVMTLLGRWFSTPVPWPPLELSEEDFEDNTAKIFASGIFGFQDESARDVRKLNAITQKKGPRWWIRLRLVLGSVFPSYRNMRFSPYYAFLEGRPWLLPIAWFYRFWRAIRYRLGGNGLHMMENAAVPDAQLDDYRRKLARWGL